MLLKKPVLAFLGIMAGLGVGASVYVRTAHFASLVKRYAFPHIPREWGLRADFESLSIGIFPPTLSVHSPEVALNEKNLTNLPADSVIRARRIDLAFRPFEALSNRIRIREVAVVGGEISLNLDRDFLRDSRSKKPVKTAGPLRWRDLAQIDIEGVSLEDTTVHIDLAEPSVDMRLDAKRVRIERWELGPDRGYEAEVAIANIEGRYPPEWGVPGRIDSLEAKAKVDPTGLEVNALRVALEGLALESRGRLTGDLLGTTPLSAEASVNLKGEISRILAAFAPQLKDPGARGDVEFEGRVRANPARLLETLRAEGTLKGASIEARGWSFDELRLEGAWSASGGGGEIALKKGYLFSENAPRVLAGGGTREGRLARGGRVEIGEFRWKPGSKAPIAVPLTLKDAHIHWLAAGAADGVFPLDFRANGSVLASVDAPTPGKPVGLSAALDLAIPRFSLDNQRMKRVMPMANVLDVRNVKLAGGVRIDDQSIKPQGLVLTLPKTRFDVGGEIHFKNGFDLRATGNATLEDLGKLAQNEIRGSGRIDTHVHGPAEAVVLDFDVDLQDAYYIQLHFGSVKGRISWEDVPARLHFKGIQAQRGRTPYHADGVLNLAPGQDTIDLGVELPRGQLSDFLPIFQDLTRELSWFPRTLIGNMKASIRVTGGILIDKLKVLGKIEGTGWEYLGEGFRSVAITGGYDRGDYLVEHFRATKLKGSLQGRIKFDKQERYDWDLSSDGLAISDLDTLARLNVPIRGRLGITSRGEGKLGAIEGDTRVTLTEASVRGIDVPASELKVKNSGGTLTVQGQAMGGQGVVDAVYPFRPGAPSHVRVDLRGLDFSPILLLLNPRSIQDRELKGRVSGGIDLQFRTGEVEYATGKIEINEYLLAKTGTKFTLLQPVSTRVERGTFSLEGLGVRGPQGSELRMRLRGRNAELSGGIQGDIHLGLLEFLTPTIARAGGRAKIDADIGGTIKEPQILASANFREGTLWIDNLETPFENITGRAELRQNIIQLPQLEADLANGRVSANGTITLYADRVPALNLKGALSGNRLKVYPFQFARVKGGLRVHGDSIPYTVDGDLEVDSALSREKMPGQGQVGGLKSARFLPPPNARKVGDFPLFKLNIQAEAARNVLVQNELFDVEMKGRLTIVNTIEVPRLLGKADLIQGRILFKDRVFSVQSASVVFDNPAVLNPAFNLTANTDISGTRVQIYAQGRMDDYRIELSSNPVMPENEILSLLTLGFSGGEARRIGATDRNTLEQGDAASLLLHSLDFNREIQNRTGFEIQLDENIDDTQGVSVKRPRETDVTGATKIVLRRRIGKRVNFSFGSTVGSGGSAQQEVNTEVRVTPGFSVIGIWEGALDGADQTSRPSSWGLDLKLQKRFK